MLRNLHAALYTHMEANGSLEAPPLPLPARRARAANAQVPGQRENVSLTHAREAARASS